MNHLEKVVTNGKTTEVLQPSRDIDINMPIVEVHDDVSEMAHERDGVDGDLGAGLLSQDSDPFNLLPIIEAVSRGGMKRHRDEDDEELEVFEEGLTRVNKIQRSGVDQAEVTYEGSPRS